MRRLLACSAFLLLSVAANAQYPPRDYGRYYDRGELFGRVRADLDRAESNPYANRGDRHRFNKVREELNEFQRSGSKHELNDTISSLQRVVNDNRISPRDRDALADDLYRLRDFRARQGWH